MVIERIDDPSDPRVADYRDVKDAELRLRQGLFVAESRLVVRRLLAGSRFRTRSVLGTPPALEDLRELIARRPEPIRVYSADHAVVRAIAGFNFHRGCLAIAERGVDPPLDTLVETPGPRALVILEDLADPDNVGGIFRNAAAFGVDAVLLSRGTADPLYRKAIRASAAATLAVPFTRMSDWRLGLVRVQEAGYTLVALTPSPGATAIDAVGTHGPLPQRIALLLGTEHHGLSDEARRAASLEVRIPMKPGFDSLNVVAACAIALHRFRGPLLSTTAAPPAQT